MADQIDWQSRAERAEKACAEMRRVLENSKREHLGHRVSWGWFTERDHALSSSCGKDYVRREELDASREELFAHAKVAARVEMGLKEELNAAKAEVERLRGALTDIKLVEWSEANARDYWNLMHDFATKALSAHKGDDLLICTKCGHGSYLNHPHVCH